MKMLEEGSIFRKDVPALAIIGLMLASSAIIGHDFTNYSAAALENVIASKTIVQGSSDTTTVEAVQFEAKKSILRASGVITVGIVQENAILATASLSSSSLKTTYTTVQTKFNNIQVTDDFDIVITYEGSGSVQVSSIAVIGQTTVSVDSTAPSVTITSPTNGATVPTSSRSVQGTASDNSGGSGVSMVQVKLDSGSYIMATPKAVSDWSAWTASVNIGTAGAHTIYAKVTDKAGNSKEVSVTVSATAPTTTSDTTAPSVTITNPASGSTITAGTIITVQGTSSDNSGGSGVNSVQVRVGTSSSFVTATPKSASDWSTWSAAVSISNGQNTIIARATDKAGNSRDASITVTGSTSTITDTTSPSVAITQPAANSIVTLTSSNIIVTGTSSDSGSGVMIVEVRVDSGAYVTATPKSTGDWSNLSVTLPITAGEHRIVPRVTDNAGNQAWNSIYVTFAEPAIEDTTPPSVAITSPAGGSTVTLAGSTITIQGTASDSGSGINTVQVRIDDGSYSIATPKSLGDWSTWSISIPITVGEHRIVPRATDNAGNNAWNSIYVTVTLHQGAVVEEVTAVLRWTSLASKRSIQQSLVETSGTSTWQILQATQCLETCHR